MRRIDMGQASLPAGIRKKSRRMSFFREAISAQKAKWGAATRRIGQFKSTTARVASEFGITEADLAVWGNKESGKRARKQAERSGQEVVRLEDSFIGFYETKNKKKTSWCMHR